MSSNLMRLNTKSISYTGNQTFAANAERSYLFILATTGDASVSFGTSGDPIPLAEGFHYEPYVCPVGPISVITTGTFVIHTNANEVAE